MRTPKIVKASSSADLLRLVPALAGVDPRESLVLVAFRGRRTAGAMRFDLPEVRRDEDADLLAAWAARAVGTLVKLDGVDGVVPVVYTAETFVDAVDSPRRALLETVGLLCVRAGVPPKDLLCVGGDAWASLGDPTEPLDPRPLLELMPDDLSGIDDVRRTEDATRIPEQDGSAQAAFARRVDAWLTGEGQPVEVHGRPVDAGYVRRGRPARAGLVDRALDGQDVSLFIEDAFSAHTATSADGAPSTDRATWTDVATSAGHAPGAPCECLALLAALLRAPVLRDVVMLQAGWGVRFGRHVARRTVMAPIGAAVDEAVFLAFAGGDFARPDIDRVERAATVLALIAGALPVPDRAPALTVAAWLHWALGHGSAAGALVDLAAASDPAYGLAEILSVRLAHGHLPEWAFHDEPGTAAGRRWRDPGGRSRR